MERSNWLFYTVGVGLIPLVFRILTGVLVNSNLNLFNLTDFVFFGLVLSITNINEVEITSKKTKTINRNWNIRTVRYSIMLITLYILFFVLCLINEANNGFINIQLLTFLTLMLNITNFAFSWTVYKFA